MKLVSLSAIFILEINARWLMTKWLYSSGSERKSFLAVSSGKTSRPLIKIQFSRGPRFAPFIFVLYIFALFNAGNDWVRAKELISLSISRAFFGLRCHRQGGNGALRRSSRSTALGRRGQGSDYDDYPGSFNVRILMYITSINQVHWLHLTPALPIQHRL